MTNENDKVRIKLVRQQSPADIQQRRGRQMARGFIIVGVLAAFVLGFAFSSVLSRTTGTTDDMATLRAVYQIMEKKFYYAQDTDEYRQKLLTDAINGMVDAQGDKHTIYMTSDEYAAFTDSLDSNFVGIGITYQAMTDSILVRKVILGSPAATAGLQAGDVITAVDGTVITADNMSAIVTSIKGQAGTEVRLTVLRQEHSQDVTVTRGVVSNTVDSQADGELGIISISSFSTGTAAELGTHLASLQEKGVRRLIIDLRDDGGGYLTTLAAAASYFLDTGTVIIRQKDNQGIETDVKAADATKYKYDRIVILTNANTASSAEAFTLALKEHCGAVTVGDTTYGKGEAQVTKLFTDGSALNYTEVLWYSDSGASVAGVGIVPDVPVRLAAALYMKYLDFKDDESYAYDGVSEVVAHGQLMLQMLGYNVDRVDGYFDAATRQAFAAFQKEQGLTASGVFDKATAQALNAAVLSAWHSHPEVYDTQMKAAKEAVNG